MPRYNQYEIITPYGIDTYITATCYPTDGSHTFEIAIYKNSNNEFDFICDCSCDRSHFDNGESFAENLLQILSGSKRLHFIDSLSFEDANALITGEITLQEFETAKAAVDI